jgi:hypothetical protein
MMSLRLVFLLLTLRFCGRSHDREQVSEELVLTDTTGLHLGAGPYLLMYSRALSEDELANHEATSDWPELLLVRFFRPRQLLVKEECLDHSLSCLV